MLRMSISEKEKLPYNTKIINILPIIIIRKKTNIGARLRMWSMMES